ncbi:MAG: hypothetical protein EOM26_01470 [Alphaproteobacteria bacterium]|nr:hypothetical protein [Alphaproteobacteria bacterium]
MATLFFFGDSIAAGAWDERGGWVDRVAGEILKKTESSLHGSGGYYCFPYNLGVSGDTAPEVLERLQREIDARIDEQREAVGIVLAVGVNDSIVLEEENKPRFTNDEFRENVRRLAVMAKAVAGRVAFVGLLPVDEALVAPMPWAPSMSYRNTRIHAFEGVIATVCAQEDLRFLPLFERWIAKPKYKALLSDGVHPNSDGHAALAEEIGAFLFADGFADFHSVRSTSST